MLEPFDRAPNFELEADDGARVQLSTLLQDGPLILYFYPADFTPGCTQEACALRDLHADELHAQKLGAQNGLRVFGISPQSAASHRRFRARHQLPFRLLADPARTAIRAYGVAGPFGLGVRRATFHIGANGIVLGRVLADFRITRHTDFVRAALSE